jgi:hypothetical protein
MLVERWYHRFMLVEVTNPRILESLDRIYAMPDQQVRELVRGEPQIVVEAAGWIIDDRRQHEAAAE